ncbi:MAG TPA: hypothetical protein VJ829_16260 [Candidatus Binatia bacterium]|nr:hypothetical protein [Candidatus Binatia bacterium]
MPFLHRPGCELYYEVTGVGPTVVFAHGLGGNHLSCGSRCRIWRGTTRVSPSRIAASGPRARIPGVPFNRLLDEFLES